MQSTSGSPSQRIPTLDGWRGVAILMVLIHHALLGARVHAARQWFLGSHGVAIFFVLSGYLITAKLLEGQHRLRSFYLRRAFRILPCALCFLAALGVANLAAHGSLLQSGELARCVLCVRNYFTLPHDSGITLHFWSLSVEEQFYFVWPAVLLCLGRRRAGWVAALTAGLCAFYRFQHWNDFQAYGPWRTELHVDALLVGCLLAIATPVREWIQRHHAVLTPAALLVFVWEVLVLNRQFFTSLTEAVAIGVLMVASLAPRSPAGFALRFRPLCWLGLISYSVYVWQQPFLLASVHANIWLRLLSAVGLATASYHFIEAPALRLGRRLDERGNGFLADAVERENAPRDEVARAAVRLDGDASYG